MVGPYGLNGRLEWGRKAARVSENREDQVSLPEHSRPENGACRGYLARGDSMGNQHARFRGGLAGRSVRRILVWAPDGLAQSSGKRRPERNGGDAEPQDQEPDGD